MNNYVVITGGAGFIGSNIAIELSKKYKVIICDKIENKLKKKNISLIKGKRIIKISELFKFIEKNRRKVTAVIHMGATTSTAEKNLERLLKNNYFFSLKLFNLCNLYKIKFF